MLAPGPQSIVLYLFVGQEVNLFLQPLFSGSQKGTFFLAPFSQFTTIRVKKHAVTYQISEKELKTYLRKRFDRELAFIYFTIITFIE